MGKRFNIALMIMVFMASTPLWWSSYKEWVLPEQFMQIEVDIRDAVTGSDHEVFVDREIYTPFGARWIVEILNADNGEMTDNCIGRGENIYKPTDSVKQPVDLFGWWMDRDVCVLQPGNYYTQTLWTMTITGYPVKVLHNRSNIFRVLPE